MKHAPIRPARDMMEEQVYARRWKELMGEPAENAEEFDQGILHDIMRSYPYAVDQRVAAVCASMVVWFGTNVGNGFLRLAAEIRSKAPSVRFPYLAAWGECNARLHWMNSSARQIEFLTRKQEELDMDIFSEVSVKDLEALEQLCIWLGGNDGQAFLRGCEAEITRRKELESVVFHSAAGRQDWPSVRKLIDKIAMRE